MTFFLLFDLLKLFSSVSTQIVKKGNDNGSVLSTNNRVYMGPGTRFGFGLDEIAS